MWVSGLAFIKDLGQLVIGAKPVTTDQKPLINSRIVQLHQCASDQKSYQKNEDVSKDPSEFGQRKQLKTKQNTFFLNF